MSRLSLMGKPTADNRVRLSSILRGGTKHGDECKVVERHGSQPWPSEFESRRRHQLRKFEKA